ncbi:hypothetical protein NDN08_008077 [Rhodosorus marinus]|uniref:C3H1-type domain-containing protein n=1 Tax=Rhodosorus marinus TaxID=101924 RepID=A0AAV8V0I0_9RHOD|nr:hypothetical protein NDN08_008077 [Rhodosorus marinus]
MNQNAFGGGFGATNNNNGNGGVFSRLGDNNNNQMEGGNRSSGGAGFQGDRSGPRNSQNSRVCKFWLKGTCNYGANCKFEHPTGANPGGQSMSNPQNNTMRDGGHNAFGNNNNNNAFGAGRGNSNNTFGAGGGAGFGNDNNRNGFGFGSTSVGNNSGGKQKSVCRHWLKGQCKFGPENCKYEHPAAQEELILEDLMNGIPQWPLSGYGRKNQASVVVGDVSPEELRVSGYAAAFSGATKDAIVESEAQAVQAQKQKFITVVDENKAKIESIKRSYT